jgi:hypothetical protein
MNSHDAPAELELDRPLYDRVVQLTGSSDAAEEFIHDATRFWLGIAESQETLPKLTAGQELLARRVLNFLAHTDHREAHAAMLLMEAFEERQRGRVPPPAEEK